MPISKRTRDSQDQLLAAVKKSQKAVVGGVGASAKVVGKAVPALPARPKGLATTEEVVDNAFDYAAKLLKAQRKFARELLSAAAPVLEKGPARPRRSTRAASSTSATTSAKSTATKARTTARKAKTRAKAKAPVKTT